MRCVKCGGKTKAVTTWRKKNGTKVRRRVCEVCGTRFTTYELIRKDGVDTQ